MGIERGYLGGKGEAVSLLEKAQNIDRRWVYLLVWVFVLLPLVKPMGLPVPIGRFSRDWKNYIDNIPEGSVIFVSMDYGVGSIPELYPLTVATMKHLWGLIQEKALKIVVIATHNMGPLVFDDLLNKVDPAANYGLVYGEDWVEMGWVPGGETGMAALATDIWAQLPRDYLQDLPVAELSIMQDIEMAEDVDHFLVFGSYGESVAAWLRQWNTPYGVPFIFAVHGMVGPGMAPYLSTGQISALLPGLTACAEYENLIKEPGLAVAASDSVSMSHLLIVLLVMIGNVAFLASGGTKKS